MDERLKENGMTDEQSRLLLLLTRHYELTTMQESATDPEALEYIAERKKALSELIEKTLNAEKEPKEQVEHMDEQEEENGMTDEQYMHLAILERLDELCLVENVTTDPEAKKYIDERKAELRAKIDRCMGL